MSLKETYDKMKETLAEETKDLKAGEGASAAEKNAMLFRHVGEVAMKKLDHADIVAILQTLAPELVVDGDLNKTMKRLAEEADEELMLDLAEALVEAVDSIMEAEEAEDGDDDDDKEDEADAKDDDKEDLEEAFNRVLGKTMLSEETKRDAFALFEAAVVDKATSLAESKMLDLKHAMEADIGELAEHVDSAIEAFADRFIAENQLAIEQGLRFELMESFMASFKSLVEEHNFDIDVADVDLTNQLSEQVATVESKLDAALNENAELRRALKAKDKTEALNEAAKGLAMSEKEKLAVLAEEIEYTSPEKYRQKLKVIAEQYFGRDEDTGSVEQHVEGVLVEEKQIDASVDVYADAISRTLKK